MQPYSLSPNRGEKAVAPLKDGRVGHPRHPPSGLVFTMSRRQALASPPRWGCCNRGFRTKLFTTL